MTAPMTVCIGSSAAIAIKIFRWHLTTSGIFWNEMMQGSERSVMYKHILIPTDGSELSMKAVEHGVHLARALKARVTSITITSLSKLYEIEPASFTELPEEWGYKKLMERFANKCLDQVKTAALAQDVSCDVMYVEHERPYQAIIDAANNQHCDLIVMASHGRHGISAIVLGSVTVKVLTHSTIPVLVYR
jgi:nucleotide-binding universal stress UspA family protein